MEDETAGLKTRLENIKREQHDVETRRNRSRLDIMEAEQLIKKYEDHQMLVRNNREFDALTKEVEAQRTRIQDATKFIESTENKSEEAEMVVVATETRLEEVQSTLSAKREQLSAVLATTDQRQANLEDRRQEAAGKVDSRYLLAYTKLRKKLRTAGPSLCCKGGAAGGFAVPPQRRAEIRQRNRIIPCEHTGRIIVDSELYMETTQNFSA